ncbi:MAG: 7TM diverse intracellular signaling domain-containing protein [Oligoflexus sp.]
MNIFHRIIILIICLTAKAQAEPLDIMSQFTSGSAIGKHLEYFVDESKQLTIHDIHQLSYQKEFLPLKDDISVFRVNPGAVWIKLELENKYEQNKDLLLEIRYSQTDYVDFFAPQLSGFSHQISGDRRLHDSTQLSHRQPVFEIAAPPGKSIYFIRLDTKGSIFVPFYLWSPKDFYDYQRLDSYMVGLIFGFMIVMLGYNSFLTISFRSRSYFLYVASLSCYVLAQLGLMGFYRQLIPNGFGIWMGNQGFLICSLLAGICINSFTKVFLMISKETKVIKYALDTLSLVGYLSLVYVFYGDYSVSAKLVPIYTLCQSTVLVMSGLYFASKGYRPAIYYSVSWLTLLTGSILAALMYTGIAPVSFLTTWSLPIGACIQVILMSIGLADRVNDIRNKAEAKIKELNKDLQKHIEQVEEIVEKRTQTIRMILDNVKVGFLLVNREFKVEAGFTKSCYELFPEIKDGMSLAECFHLEGRTLELIELALEQVFDDNMPEIASLSALHKRISVGDKYLTIEGAVVRNSKKDVGAILLTILDSTELHLTEKESYHSRMLLKMVQYLHAFQEFITESKHSLARTSRAITQKNFIEAKAILHTLKGNFLIYGMNEIAAFIHTIEESESLHIGMIYEIESILKKFLQENHNILSLDWDDPHSLNFNVSETELIEARKLADQIGENRLRHQMSAILDKMKSIPVKQFLGPIEEEVERISKRLGKPVRIRITGKDVAIARKGFKYLFECVIHLIRNAIDHGIEADRHSVHKPDFGLIHLSIVHTESGLEIKVEDDGRGINVDKLCDLALQKNILKAEDLSKMSHQQKIQLILSGGLSTKDEVNIISGRGLGLASVNQAVQDLGGELTIDSRAGQGTVFTIFVPLKLDQQVA